MVNRNYTLHRLSTLFFFLIQFNAFSQQDIVAYTGNAGDERFNTVLQLSDSTYLVGGSSNDLAWVTNGAGKPAVQQIQLGNVKLSNNLSTKQKIGFILHISKDLKTILQVAYFSKGAVEDVRHIKTNTIPGTTTGDIYISGNVEYTEQAATGSQPARTGGYYIAKLDNNFLNGNPGNLVWGFNVWATGAHKTRQPWDVGGDGKVVYVTGNAFGTDWCGIKRRKADGSGNEVVQDWTTHTGNSVLDGSLVLMGEWTPAFSNTQVKPSESMVNLKLGNCSLRSWSPAQYSNTYTDENGTPKQGTWPLDYFFNSSCNVPFPGATQGGPGYTGYLSGDNPTGYVGGIVVDKLTNEIYFGASFQSTNNAGLDDAEPFVMAYTSTGAKKWWARLYQETSLESPPAQYVDALTIDYSGIQKSLIVVGRQEGYTAKSLWPSNTITNNPLLPFGTATFMQAYTGNVKVAASWIGKYSANNGTLLYSTYIAGFAGSGNGIDATSVGTVTESLYFPSYNKGNPDLNDAFAEIDVKTDNVGRIYVLLQTRGFTSTNNAYQKQEPPVPNLISSNRRDTPGDYVVVYESDLKRLVYSSLLTGEWNRIETNPQQGSVGGGNTDLLGLFPWKGGVTVVGYQQDLNNDNIPDGNSIPFYYQYKYGNTTSTILPAFTPTWGRNTLNNSDGEVPILARLTFTKTVRADFSINPAGGACTNTSVQFTDLSYADTGILNWSWSFDAGANPATSSQQNPTVQWTTAGQKNITLTVQSKNGATDTRTITYFVNSVPSATFNYTGSTGPAPAAISFNGPSGVGLSYLWTITDPNTGQVTNFSTQNPSYTFPVGGTPGTSYPVSLTVTQGTCSQTTTQNILISAGPGPIKPDFTINGQTPANAPTICMGNTVTFQQVNASNITSWQWSFGDGAVPASANTKVPPVVYYTSSGPKTATLTVSNNSSSATYTFNFGVATLPAASFTYNSNTPNAPAVYNFVADEPSASQYSWDFGNGRTSSRRSPTNITYSNPGQYTVRLRVTSANGCTTTNYQNITVGNANSGGFQSNFDFGPANGACVNNKVTIREMATGGQSSSTSNFSWNFGQNAQVVGAGNGVNTFSGYKPPLVYWTTPGQKVVTLTVTYNGQTSVMSQVYQIYPYPNPAFTVDASNSTCATGNNQVTFSPIIVPGAFYQWNFGTGATPATSNNTNPAVTFPDGKYPVQLTVTSNGCRSINVQTVQVGSGNCGIPSPSAGISVQPSRAGCAVNEYVVQSTSTGNISSNKYVWTFPGNTGVSRSGSGPRTLTLNSGDVITLQVTDQSGKTDTVSVTIP